MILIADSGSTKTDWCVVEHGQLIQQIFTKGTNPFFQSEEEISNEIATALIPQLKTNKFEAVHFYCKLVEKSRLVRICSLLPEVCAVINRVLPVSWVQDRIHVITMVKTLSPMYLL